MRSSLMLSEVEEFSGKPNVAYLPITEVATYLGIYLPCSLMKLYWYNTEPARSFGALPSSLVKCLGVNSVQNISSQDPLQMGVFGNNVVLSGFDLVQIRSTPVTCPSQWLKEDYVNCINVKTTFDDRDYGPGWTPPDGVSSSSVEGFTYTSDAELGPWAVPTRSEHGSRISYGPGGYIRHLPNALSMPAIIRELLNNSWLDSRTVALILRGNVMNPGTEMVGSVHVLFELSGANGPVMSLRSHLLPTPSSLASRGMLLYGIDWVLIGINGVLVLFAFIKINFHVSHHSPQVVAMELVRLPFWSFLITGVLIAHVVIRFMLNADSAIIDDAHAQFEITQDAEGVLVPGDNWHRGGSRFLPPRNGTSSAGDDFAHAAIKFTWLNVITSIVVFLLGAKACLSVLKIFDFGNICHRCYLKAENLVIGAAITLVFYLSGYSMLQMVAKYDFDFPTSADFADGILSGILLTASRPKPPGNSDVDMPPLFIIRIFVYDQLVNLVLMGICSGIACQIVSNASARRRDERELETRLSHCITRSGLRGTSMSWLASGLRWRNLGSARPSRGLEVFNEGLQNQLAVQTEFTQEEWDAFGIADLHDDDFVQSGLAFFGPTGTFYEQIDKRRLDLQRIVVREIKGAISETLELLKDAYFILSGFILTSKQEVKESVHLFRGDSQKLRRRGSKHLTYAGERLKRALIRMHLKLNDAEQMMLLTEQFNEALFVEEVERMLHIYGLDSIVSKVGSSWRIVDERSDAVSQSQSLGDGCASTDRTRSSDRGPMLGVAPAQATVLVERNGPTATTDLEAGTLARSTVPPVEAGSPADAPSVGTEATAQAPSVKSPAQAPSVKSSAQAPSVKAPAQAPSVRAPAQAPSVKAPAQAVEAPADEHYSPTYGAVAIAGPAAVRQKLSKTSDAQGAPLRQPRSYARLHDEHPDAGPSDPGSIRTHLQRRLPDDPGPAPGPAREPAARSGIGQPTNLAKLLSSTKRGS